MGETLNAFTKIVPTSIDLAQSFTFTGTVAGAGADNKPSFSAFMNANQNVSHNSMTKLQFNTEINDSDSAYDHSSAIVLQYLSSKEVFMVVML